MSLRIRLSRAGARKRPHYRIVVADSRSPRDGRFIEKLGTYSPLLDRDDPGRIRVDAERAQHWIANGARPSDRVAILLGQAEVMPMPPRRDNPIKAKPKAKAQERLAAAAEAQEKARQAAEAPAAEQPQPGGEA